jgi:hypothetical protein
MSQDKSTIENIRKAMGTLPSDKPIKRTDIVSLKDSLEVTIESCTDNPYKAMVVSSTATWGDNDCKQKWPLLKPEGRLEIIKACLLHLTLPQCKENVHFVFRIKGVPRWLFDYHVTNVQFISVQSAGCRDNNKLDADIVKQEVEGDKQLFSDLKDLYEIALSDSQGSWQTARAFLSQSYSHSYILGQNLLSIVGVKGFHASKKLLNTTHEEVYLAAVYQAMIRAITDKFPLIGVYCKILFHANEEIFDFIRNLKYEELDIKDKKLFEL